MQSLVDERGLGGNSAHPKNGAKDGQLVVMVSPPHPLEKDVQSR